MVNAINQFLARVRESTERRVFIADAAHELRTPLAAMRINVEALQAYVSSDNQQALLAGIIRSNSRAARLVNQLLLMMHSEASVDTAMEPVPLTTLIRSAWRCWHRSPRNTILSLNSTLWKKAG